MSVNIAMASGLLFRKDEESLGPAFPFVKALKAVNAECDVSLFKVQLLDEKPDSLEDTIRTHELEELITVLNVGEDLVGELKRNNTILYLSDSETLVKTVLAQGIAAAFMFTPDRISEVAEHELRVAFDGDSVLFTNESERVYQEKGLEGFLEHEEQMKDQPLGPGPFREFFRVLEMLKRKLHDGGVTENCPIRTYLVTSRSEGPPKNRALNTLRFWALDFDESFYLGNTPKGPTLEKIRPHLFFDDQKRHVDAALKSEPEMSVNIAMASGLLFRKDEKSSSTESLGPAFPFVNALKAVNAKLNENYPESVELFKVKLLVEKPSDSLEDTICTYELAELITVLNVGEDLVDELKRNNTILYLSDSEPLVKNVLEQGIAAAVMFTPKEIKEVSEDQLRVAFDGDAVLFSNESECVFKNTGLTGYLKHERENVEKLMKPGPFCAFLDVLEKLKKKLREKGLLKDCPIRTYLVTARSAGCDGYRALNTLHSWALEVDEAVFLGLSPKGPPLQIIRPHLFFDDQKRHIEAALEVGTVPCHVPNDP